MVEARDQEAQVSGYAGGYAISPFPTGPGVGTEATDKAVLYWDGVNNLVKGSADFIFNETLKQLVLGTGSQLMLPAGSAGSPSLVFDAAGKYGMWLNSGTNLDLSINGLRRFSLSSSQLNAFVSTFQIGGSAEVSLSAEAANILSLRNSTNAQEFRVYGSYAAGATDYLSLRMASGEFKIAADFTGTGTKRDINLLTDSTKTVWVQSGGLTPYPDNTPVLGTASYRWKSGYITDIRGSSIGSASGDFSLVSATASRWLVKSDGMFVPFTDATFDLGSASARVRTGYFGGVAASIGLVVKAHASQTANLQEWQNSSGTPLSRIKSDGRWRHDGATTWNDLRIEPVARSTGANAPSFEKYFDDVPGSSRGVYLYSFNDATAGSEKEIFFTMQMPHDWKEGTAIRLHCHWVGSVSDTTSAPRWGLEYTWKDIGQVFGDTTIVYSTGVNIDGQVGGDPNITAGKHYISEFTAITPGTDANNISSIIIGRLFRDSANAGDTYNAATNKCGLLYIDAHYEVDSFGSDTEFTKG